MKVAYITNLYFKTKSGPARFVEHLRQYSSDKINFTFFTDDLVRKPTQNEVKVKIIPMLDTFPGYWLIRSYLFYRAFRKSSNSFDLIICSNAFEAFFLVFLIKKTPVIVMINDDNYIFTRYNLKKVLKSNSIGKTFSRYLGFYIEKAVVLKATKVIVCSNYLKRTIIENYKILEGKIELIYPAVDLGFFTPLKNKTYFKDHKINILFTKNDWRRGGLDSIIEDLSKYKEQNKIHLNIVGTPAKDKNSIIKIANNTGFTGVLNFYGILDKNELLNKFYEADLLVLLSRQEAFGIVLLEALATATPVIASNVGGIPEVLDNDKGGFLVAPDSPEEFVSILNKLIQHPDLISPKVEYGLIHCKKFGKNNLYLKLEDLILALGKK